MNPFELSAEKIGRIREQVTEKRRLAAGRKGALFDILTKVQDFEELLALEFLYAAMPRSDLASYRGEDFLQHVRHSLRTKSIVPWGWKVKGELFLHFVLPPRINNEAICHYRPYFFQELFERVKGLSLREAILETNYWCHSKVKYGASDPLTVSPLALVRAGQGRCGEESVFLTAALRSLGIPARQVYAPLWAHTDSNHAWVEAWADGHWYYLGACEPQPRLNLGWFSDVASRAMLIHTRVPGTIYEGPEEIIQARDGFTELNLTRGYAPTRQLRARVRDGYGSPIPGAFLDFQIYNYGGFEALTRLVTGKNGAASLTVGLGDVLLHAAAAGSWGAALAKADDPQEVEVILGQDGLNAAFKWNVPAQASTQKQALSAKEKARHERGLHAGNQKRRQQSSFLATTDALQLALELGVDAQKLQKVWRKARGGAGRLGLFLKKAGPEYGHLALDLLAVLAPKDLLDVEEAVLWDCLRETKEFAQEEAGFDFLNYVLQPRVFWEVLQPYRGFFKKEFDPCLQRRFRQNPLEIQNWISTQITTLKEDSWGEWSSPRGVYELQAGSPAAKQVLFVALARSFGIGARFSLRDGQSQYWQGGRWLDAGPVVLPRGILELLPAAGEKPLYYQDFSLARLEGNAFQKLRFRGLDEEAANDEDFKFKLALLPGYYRLTAGTRLPSGAVLALKEDFWVLAGQITQRELTLPRERSGRPALGLLPTGLSFRRLDGSVFPLPPGQSLLIAWIEPACEPTEHFLRQLSKNRAQLTDRVDQIILSLPQEALPMGTLGDLPPKAVLVKDEGNQALWELFKSLPSLPAVLLADKQGVIRCLAQGYEIGLLPRILKQVEEGFCGNKP